MLMEMKNPFYQTKNEKKEVEEEEPWHLISSKPKLALDKIRELATHVEMNEEITNRVAMFVLFTETSALYNGNRQMI